MSDGIRWARSDDHHLPYRVVEADPGSEVTVLLATGAFLPIESMWGDPIHARFLDGLASLGRLVVFDRRGVGSADPVSSWDEPIIHQWARDTIAVVEALERGPVHIVAWEWGSLQAQVAASNRPDLFATLVLLHSMVDPERVSDIVGMPAEQLGDLMADWITGTGPHPAGDAGTAELYAPSRAGDVDFQRWFDEAGRHGVSPMTGARMWRSCCTPGLGIDHSAITAPVLSLRRRDAVFSPQALTREVADAVPNGTHVELPGSDFAPFGGDVDALVAEIARFITGEEGRLPRSDRSLVAVAFVDIVGSTEAVRRLGDDRWRLQLDAYDARVHRVFARHGGRIVKQTGDGSLAVFALASRAVRAAVELREEVAELGLQIRQGIHVGEVLDRHGDISGRAVHIAARIMGLAGAGQIRTTAAVPLVTDAAQVVFRAAAAVELRGLEGEWHTFIVDGAA